MSRRIFRPGSYLVESGPELARDVVVECATCKHCGSPIPLRGPGGAALSPERTPGICLRCMGPTCARCALVDRCTPFEARIERAERR